MKLEDDCQSWGTEMQSNEIVIACNILQNNVFCFKTILFQTHVKYLQLMVATSLTWVSIPFQIECLLKLPFTHRSQHNFCFSSLKGTMTL